MTLDQRIEEDLKDLYDSGILKFIEQFKNCKIKEAEELSKNLFDTPNELSSHGLPGYFTGNRVFNEQNAERILQFPNVVAAL